MYHYTEEEKAEVLAKYFSSNQPLIMSSFPKKLKKKYLTLVLISEAFEEGNIYTEKEVNEILQVIYSDYVMIRRSLIDYGFMERKKDGSEYWKSAQVNP